MKKFLCYDTNDAASGKINVDSRGVLKPNSTVPSSSSEPYKSLVTDGEGGVKWEDRLAYSDSRVVVHEGIAVHVKVSDEVPSWVSAGASMRVWTHYTDDSGRGEINQVDNIESFGDGVFLSGAVFFIMTDNVELIDEDINLVFPEKGVYLFSVPNSFYISGIASADSDTPEITWDGNIGVIKKIDKKYIPSELNEIILPSSTSGSSKKFKITVDDSGAITATEV